MKVGCVILNYNDFENTDAQLKRISGYGIWEGIVVVDNRSSDDSFEKLKEAWQGRERVFLIRTAENKGYGAGNNAGIWYACDVLGCTHVVIANPDTHFTEQCVTIMAKAAAAREEIGVVAATMVDSSNGSQASGWRLLSFTEELLNTGPVCRRLFRKRLNGPAGYGQGKKAVYVDAVHGSMLMVDGKKMKECGGYDERVFLYGEENILAQRMKALGYRTVQLKNVTYRHENSASISKTYSDIARRQKLRHESAMFYYKHYLHINRIQELAARAFFGAVMAEVWFCSRILGMRW